MDEWLLARVVELKVIDERLERILRTPNGLWDWDSTKQAITNLRNELATMIRAAQEDYDDF